MEYREHVLIWTDEHIARFWNFYSQFKPVESHYYTAQVGDALINFTKKHADIQGQILDYGTGRGYLIQHLLQKRFGDVMGCDFSRESVETVNSKFTGQPRFKGCILIEKLPSFLSDGKFDAVFCIEALEHLTDQYLNATILEIKRIMAPGALLVITVPNNENLDEHKVICPDCGAVFHRVQHVRSFDQSGLDRLLTEYGFSTVACDVLNLFDYKPGSAFKRWVRKAAGFFKSISLPHLIYIGKKNER